MVLGTSWPKWVNVSCITVLVWRSMIWICIPDMSGSRSLNGVSLAGRRWPNIECWLGSFVIFQGIRTSITKKTYIFVVFFFRGVGGLNPLSPLWIRTCQKTNKMKEGSK